MIYCFKFILLSLSTVVFRLLNYCRVFRKWWWWSKNQCFPTDEHIRFIFTHTHTQSPHHHIYIRLMEIYILFLWAITLMMSTHNEISCLFYWILRSSFSAFDNRARLRFSMKLQAFAAANWFYDRIIYGKSMRVATVSMRVEQAKKKKHREHHTCRETIVESLLVEQVDRLEIMEA